MTCNNANNLTLSSYLDRIKQSYGDIGCPSYNCETPQTHCTVPSQSYINYVSTQPQHEHGKQWIDYHLQENYEFGWRVIDNKSGKTDLGLIPLWLVNTCPEQTGENEKGIMINSNGDWTEYIEIKGQRAYQYAYNCQTQERLEGGNWLWGIGDCAIVDVDADKIINYCKLFEKVTTPISHYTDLVNGCVSSEYKQVPVVLTENCQLATLIQCKDVRQCVIPSLTAPNGQALWDYNPITDGQPVMVPENLDCQINVCVDGTTIRPGGEEGVTKGGAGQRPGGKVLTAYTYVELEGPLTGSGTPGSPLDIKDGSITAEKLAVDALDDIVAGKPISYIFGNKYNSYMETSPAFPVSVSGSGTPTGASIRWEGTAPLGQITPPFEAPTGYRWTVEIEAHCQYDAGTTGDDIRIRLLPIIGDTSEILVGSQGIPSGAFTIVGVDAHGELHNPANKLVNGNINTAGRYNITSSGATNTYLRCEVYYYQSSNPGDRVSVVNFYELWITGEFKLVKES